METYKGIPEISVSEHQLHTQDQHIYYRLYRNSAVATDRRLLLLHGAGVAGQLTWEPLLKHLTGWSEILVPDLRGMGRTVYPDGRERPFTADAVLGDVLALLDHRGWERFDLGGYSFGGMIAMLLKQARPEAVAHQFLLESALLEREDVEAMRQVRRNYADCAQQMRAAPTPQAGIRAFLDLIAPNRPKNERMERTTVSRLAHRVEGFSYALDCVTHSVNNLDRGTLLAPQANVDSFIGGRTLPHVHEYHQKLALKRPDWRYHEVPGADHSLPFQKPHRIARHFNAVRAA